MHTPDFLKDRLAPGARQTLVPLRQVLKRLGQPQRAFPVVGVTGTNGKGSTSLFLQHILAASGCTTGLLNSPSLHSLRELILVKGRWLEPPVFRALCEEVVAVAVDEPLTLFELLVAVACRAFEQAGVEVAILEAGMGGRQDATRLTEPRLTVITSLALDHRLELGGSLESIAWHKAGLASPGSRVLTAASGQGLQALERVLAEDGRPGLRGSSRLEVLGRDFSLTTVSGRVPRAPFAPEDTWIYRDGAGVLPLGPVRLGPQGLHQWENAALAVRAARALGEEGLLSSSPLEPGAVVAGLEAPGQPGRLERLRFPEEPDLPLWLDGAHNPEGALRLRESLRWLEGDVPLHLLLAVYADKELEGMLEALLPGVERLLLVQTESARAMPVSELRVRAERTARRLGWTGALVSVGGVSAGLKALQRSLLDAQAGGGRRVGVICGTLSLVEPVYRTLGLVTRLCLEDADLGPGDPLAEGRSGDGAS